LLAIIALTGNSQKDSLTTRKIFNTALLSNQIYEDLGVLCKESPGRLCGSDNAAKAINLLSGMLKDAGADTVYLQECMVRKWDRGKIEKCLVSSKSGGTFETDICALGGSVSTPEKGITAQVIELKNFDDLAKAGKEKINGKIVFFNQPLNPEHYYTFNAYGEFAKLRVYGAKEASAYGAVAVIVRSMTLKTDNQPHTGIMRYKDAAVQIPGAAISTVDADRLSLSLKNDSALTVSLTLDCKELPEVPSYNVIAEIKGSEFPDEYIVAGGHTDAWDNGEGAHDDGAGCVQSINILRIFKQAEIKPRHTLRIIMFMDEEVDQRGAKKYAESVSQKKEKHILALESDRGGYTPHGFSMEISKELYEKVIQWKKHFLMYGVWFFEIGGSGVDVGPLAKLGIPCMGLVTDSQRYFDIQHAPSDTFDKVNKRELQLGSAAMATMIWFFDQYFAQ